MNGPEPTIARLLPALAAVLLTSGLQIRLAAQETAPAPHPGGWSFVQMCDTQLVVNNHRGIQLVSGETTSKNFDNRPMGFRWWDVSAKGVMTHRFVKLEGVEALETESRRKQAAQTGKKIKR